MKIKITLGDKVLYNRETHLHGYELDKLLGIFDIRHDCEHRSTVVRVRRKTEVRE